MGSNNMPRIHTAGREASICVLVCGGRDFHDRAELSDTLDGLHEARRFAMMITGGAQGADLLAEEWAEARGLTCEVYHADPLRLRREAGRIRNHRMLTEGRPELVVAFRGGRRTEHMVRIAQDAGVEVIETGSRRFFAPFALWSRVTSALSASLWTPDRSTAYASPAPGRIARLRAAVSAIARPPLVGGAEPLPILLAPDPAACGTIERTPLKAQLALDLRAAEGCAGTEAEIRPARAKDAA